MAVMEKHPLRDGHDQLLGVLERVQFLPENVRGKRHGGGDDDFRSMKEWDGEVVEAMVRDARKVILEII